MNATIRLADYRPFSHVIDQVALTFDLHPTQTRVTARLQMRPNPANPGGDLRLDGIGLRLIALQLNGTALAITPDATGLTIPAALLPDADFVLDSVVEISPQTNTAPGAAGACGPTHCGSAADALANHSASAACARSSIEGRVAGCMAGASSN